MDPAHSLKPTWLGRYAIFDEIASGGMATVYLARLLAPAGFSRVVAVKRLHRHLLQNLEFTKMFVDEARLAARIRHPNVVPTLDVLENEGEIALVMEYVHGESLFALRRLANQQDARIPLDIAAAITINMLQGIHAAHEARDEGGSPLGMVHRDVSPQNVLLGADGVARVLDFGVAKAMQFQDDSSGGMVKGKFAYMAPEVLTKQLVTRQADVFAASTVFWELLTGQKLFSGNSDEERMRKIVSASYLSPRSLVGDIPPAVDHIVMKGLAPAPEDRYATAVEMAADLEGAVTPASQRMVSEWVSRIAAEPLETRAQLLQRIEVSQIAPRPLDLSDRAGWSSARPPDPSCAQGQAGASAHAGPLDSGAAGVLRTAASPSKVLAVAAGLVMIVAGMTLAKRGSRSMVEAPMSSSISGSPAAKAPAAAERAAAAPLDLPARSKPPAESSGAGPPALATGSASSPATSTLSSTHVGEDATSGGPRPAKVRLGSPPPPRRPSANSAKARPKDFLPDEL